MNPDRKRLVMNDQVPSRCAVCGKPIPHDICFPNKLKKAHWKIRALAAEAERDALKAEVAALRNALARGEEHFLDGATI